MRSSKHTALRAAGFLRRVTAMVVALVFSLLSAGALLEGAAAEAASGACLSIVEHQAEGVSQLDERKDSDSRDPKHPALPHCHAHAMTGETAAGPQVFAISDLADPAQSHPDQVLRSRTAAPPTRPPRF